MAQPTLHSNQDRNPTGNDAPKPHTNRWGLILSTAAIALVGGAFFVRSPSFNNTQELTYPKFEEALKSGRIAQKGFMLSSEVGSPTDELRGILLPQKGANANLPDAVPFRTRIHPEHHKNLLSDLGAYGLVPEITTGNNNILLGFLSKSRLGDPLQNALFAIGIIIAIVAIRRMTKSSRTVINRGDEKHAD